MRAHPRILVSDFDGTMTKHDFFDLARRDLPSAADHDYWQDYVAGRITHFVAVKEDITQRKAIEEQLRQAQRMEAVGQLTGGIAHDFNNMLTGIIGSLELLRRRVARGKLDDLDGLIELGVTSANRAAGLTHRLLAFSRRQSLDSKPVEINQLVTSMGELLQRSINESIALDMRLASSLWTAEADPNQ